MNIKMPVEMANKQGIACWLSGLGSPLFFTLKAVVAVRSLYVRRRGQKIFALHSFLSANSSRFGHATYVLNVASASPTHESPAKKSMQFTIECFGLRRIGSIVNNCEAELSPYLIDYDSGLLISCCYRVKVCV
jgi:hypothetical protein